MEPPVAGVGVFARAFRTERKRGQRGAGAVVGQRFGDGIAGAAAGTGEKRIAMPAVTRVEQFAAALGTGREIRRERGAAGTGQQLGAI